MKNINSKVAVITGAGSGIGRALSLALAKEGAKLALNDWNKNALEETLSLLPESTEAMGEAFDISDKKAVYDFAQQVASHFGQVDIVVNNAGIAHEQRKADAIQYDLYEKVIDVNLWGVIYGTRAFLPHLQLRPKGGTIVNISSIFGIVGQPLQAPYVISKFGVRGFTETLRNELVNSKVNITCVHPGGIKTNIINNIDTKHTGRRDKFAKAFEKMAKTTPEDAAQQIVQAIKKKKRRLLIGRDARMMDLAARWFPSIYDKMIYRGIDFDRFAAKD